MVNGEVRLKYSGIVIFLARLLSVGTGLVFTLMVTRSLSSEIFGIYGNLSDVLAYFALATGIFPFWAVRFAARDHKGSLSTVLLANIAIAVPSSIIYLVLLPTVLPILQVSIDYMVVYLLISIQIIENYVLTAIEAMLQAKKPQTIGFGLIVHETSKVCMGYVLILLFEKGLFGVVFSIIMAIFLQLLFYIKTIIPALHEKINWSYAKEWIKASPFNMYGILGQRLADSILLLLFIYGGKVARGYYGAAFTIANIVGYSSLIGYALYPRLLSKTQPEDITSSLKMVLMFAMPMTFGAIIMADSLLTILNIEYSAAIPILVLLSIDMLISCFSSVFGSVVYGAERLDAEAKIPLRKMIKSKLFLLLSLPYIQAAISLPLAYYALNYVAATAVDSAFFIASIILVIDSGLITIRYILAQKSLPFRMPLKQILKYVGAAAAMALLLYVLPRPTRLTMTVALTLLGGCAYFVVLVVIDSESRGVVRDVLKEILRKIRPNESA